LRERRRHRNRYLRAQWAAGPCRVGFRRELRTNHHQSSTRRLEGVVEQLTLSLLGSSACTSLSTNEVQLATFESHPARRRVHRSGLVEDDR